MEDGFEKLNHDEVVSIEPETFNKLDISSTFKVRDLIAAIKEYIGAEGAIEANLHNKGLSCEVLRFTSQGWQKGKVRLALEFCSYETESPLDEISEQLKEKLNLDKSISDVYDDAPPTH